MVSRALVLLELSFLVLTYVIFILYVHVFSFLVLFPNQLLFHTKTMLATTWTILEKILQQAQWCKNYVFYIKRKLFESSFQYKMNEHIWTFVERVMR